MDHNNRKTLVVALGTLILIPVILLLPGVYDSMPNRLGVIMGIGPLAIVAAVASSYRSWQAPTFFCGLTMIMLGIGFFVLQGGFGSLAKVAETTHRFSKEDVRFWTQGIELWIYTIPAISIGLGVNVVSAYISSEPPNSEVMP